MFDEIAPQHFVRLLETDDRWQLLDVRESWEIELASIAGAIRVPMMEIPSRLGELENSRPVAVICHSGGRSGRVAGFLSRQGFPRVANITGGIDAWSRDVDGNIPRY